MKYFIEDPKDYERHIEVPEYIRRKIIIDYLKTTFYWFIGLSCLIIGFLAGVVARGI